MTAAMIAAPLAAGPAAAASTGGPTEGSQAGARGHGDAPQRPPADQGARPRRRARPPSPGPAGPRRWRPDPARRRGRAADGRLLPHLLGARGLLPRDGCAPKGDIVAWASGKSRAIKTAENFVEGLQPGCGLKVAHPGPRTTTRSSIRPIIDGDIALKAAQRQKPGVAAETALHAKDFAILQRVLGCDPATKAGCDLAKRPSS
jgi:4-phytase/acid phosphatase